MAENASGDLLQKEYWDLSYISGPLVFLENGDRFPTGSILDLTLDSGEVRQGQVLEATTTHAVVQILQGTQGIDIKGTAVSLKNEGARVACSPDVIGRSFNGTGDPIDGLAPIVADQEREIGGEAMEYAIRYTDYLKANIGLLLDRITFTDEYRDLMRVRDVINLEPGITTSKLLRKTRMKAKTLKECIETLLNADMIASKAEKSKGRGRTQYSYYSVKAEAQE